METIHDLRYEALMSLRSQQTSIYDRSVQNLREWDEDDGGEDE